MSNVLQIYPDDLQAAGIAPYGPVWRVRVAQAIGCDRSRVSRRMKSNPAEAIKMSGPAAKAAKQLIVKAKKIVNRS